MSTAPASPNHCEANSNRSNVTTDRTDVDGPASCERAAREDALAIERETFGGMKVCSAVFG